MYFDTRQPGYPSSIFNAIVAPRPIGWVSTLCPDGRANLAPFSYFNGISSTPPMVMFACNAPEDRKEKDTVTNARVSGEFCVNLATFDLRDAMNMTSSTVPHGTDEFELAGLEKAACSIVACPRVAASPAALECTVLRIIDIPPEAAGDRACAIVIGRVLAVHADDRFVSAQGRFDSALARPLARLGGFNYISVDSVFEIARPARGKPA